MASLTHQDFGPKLAQSNNVDLPHSPWSREDEVLWLAYDSVVPAACQNQDPPGSTSPVAPSLHALHLLSHISLPFEGPNVWASLPGQRPVLALAALFLPASIAPGPLSSTLVLNRA